MTTSQQAASHRAVQLTAVPSAASSARRDLGSFLAGYGPDVRTVQDASLVVFELVMNAVEHGAASDHPGPITVEFTVSEAPDHVDLHLVISVHDAGAATEVGVGAVSADGADGRGLAIVAALCQSWAVDLSRGTRVTARLPLGTRPAPSG